MFSPTHTTQGPLGITAPTRASFPNTSYGSYRGLLQLRNLRIQSADGDRGWKRITTVGALTGLPEIAAPLLIAALTFTSKQRRRAVFFCRGFSIRCAGPQD
jgi:hypothetical protein